MMVCPRCNEQLEDGATFCGFCGAQIAPLQARGATIHSTHALDTPDMPGATQPQTSMPGAASNIAVQQTYRFKKAPVPNSDRYATQTPEQLSRLAQSELAARPGNTPVPAPSNIPSPRPSGSRSRLILLIVLVLIVVAGGSIGTAFVLRRSAAASASGQISFFDSQGKATGDTDALSISVSNLPAPPSGSHYNAWLINDQNEQIIALGALVQQGQTFTLRYIGDSSKRHQGTNLLGAGNKIEITQEQNVVSLPTGTVVLAGVFPPRAFVHIRHLLFQFPTTPGNIGLLVGLLNQTRLLNTQAQTLQNSSSSATTQCVAQSIVDIIEGTSGAHYRPLPAMCVAHGISAAGDGFGILDNGYTKTAAQHAALAANQIDSTATIRTFAGHVEIATTNITGWATTIDLDALNLLANPNDSASITDVVKLAAQTYNGVDANGNGHIDPIPGEAGAVTAYQQGQLMAQLPLITPVA